MHSLLRYICSQPASLMYPEQRLQRVDCIQVLAWEVRFDEVGF